MVFCLVEAVAVAKTYSFSVRKEKKEQKTTITIIIYSILPHSSLFGRSFVSLIYLYICSARCDATIREHSNASFSAFILYYRLPLHIIAMKLTLYTSTIKSNSVVLLPSAESCRAGGLHCSRRYIYNTHTIHVF